MVRSRSLLTALAVLSLAQGADARTLAPGHAHHWRVHAVAGAELVLSARAKRCPRQLAVAIDRRRLGVRITRRKAHYRLGSLTAGWHRVRLRASMGGCSGGVLISRLTVVREAQQPAHPHPPASPPTLPPLSASPPALPPLSASPPTPPPLSAPPSGPESNPFAGARFYVNPNSNAAQTEAAWRSSGRSADANAMAKIANNPQATWFGDWNGSDPYAAVHNAVSQAAGVGALPVLVTYNIPGRDCGSLSAGGAVSADAYRTFIDGFVRGISNARAVVIVEPDALPELDCMSTGNQQQTLELLRYAVTKFAASPSTAVYLDAGNSTWQPAAVIASRLQQADVAQARGFSLNVSNFNPTATEESYGNSVSTLLGGKHFLVDTSRNGQGRASDGQWCNPSGRGLGAPASTVTGDPLADALFWVKSPGESDGTCNGGPPAGSWWPDYAFGLTQRAAF